MPAGGGLRGSVLQPDVIVVRRDSRRSHEIVSQSSTVLEQVVLSGDVPRAVPERIDLRASVAHWYGLGMSMTVVGLIPAIMLLIRWWGVANTAPQESEVNNAILAAAVGMMIGQLLSRYARGQEGLLRKVWSNGELLTGKVMGHTRAFAPTGRGGLRFMQSFADIAYGSGGQIRSVYVSIDDPSVRQRMEIGRTVQLLVDQEAAIAEVPLEYGVFVYVEEDAPTDPTGNSR
jgi:hypothetical protein